MFNIFQKTATVADVERNLTLPETPRLIVQGNYFLYKQNIYVSPFQEGENPCLDEDRQQVW